MKAQTKKWKAQAVEFFESNPKRIFTRKELAAVLRSHAADFGTPRTLTAQRFIDTLMEIGQLRILEILSVAESGGSDRPSNTPNDELAGPYRPFVRYAWGKPSAYEVALSLRPDSYLSHATAVFLHGLTTQIPRRIYANKEQSAKPKTELALGQAGIDRAFANKARTSNYVFDFEGTHILLLSGKNTGNLEVTDLQDPAGSAVAVTKLERTLIDITVRPHYAGGIYEVLQAFRAARERVSVATLIATLRKLDYAYPYHQALGFYMTRAGYTETQLQRLRGIPTKFRFYLTNQVPAPHYDEAWKVYYPAGF